MGLFVQTLSVLRPDVDRMREEPSPRSVIKGANEMGRKVAKWLPGALIRSFTCAVSHRSTHVLFKGCQEGISFSHISENYTLFNLRYPFTT